MLERDNRLLQLERHRKIHDILRERGAARVSEFSDLLDISENTIRRDLILLEKKGLCLRTRGGAVLKEEQTDRLQAPPAEGSKAELTALAAAAAFRVQSGETVILDAGPACLLLAEELKKKSHVTVITTSLAAAAVLRGLPTITVILSGGIVHGRTGSLTGPPAEEFFTGIHADRLFLSVDGVSAETGLSDHTMEETAVKQRMIACADQVLVLADHTKLGRTALRRLAPLEAVDFIITGRGADPEAIRALSDAGAAVITADAEGYDLYPGSGETQ